MNYKLDNPVALKVIDCIMVDKPLAMTTIVACAKFFDNDIIQVLAYCIRLKIIKYEDALYILTMYKQTFKDIIKNRNHELSMRNVTR